MKETIDCLDIAPFLRRLQATRSPTRARVWTENQFFSGYSYTQYVRAEFFDEQIQVRLKWKSGPVKFANSAATGRTRNASAGILRAFFKSVT